MLPEIAPPEENRAAPSASPDTAARASAQAERCRRLARTIGDTVTVEALRRMADEYEAEAGAVRRA